jgi:hypothetical protein
MSISNIHNTPVCIRQEINNGLLKTKNAMPQKDGVSDGQSSFSIDRRAFNETWTASPAMTALNPPHYGVANSRGLPTVFDGTHSLNQKKWHSNRDASEIVRRARVMSVGLGSLNTNGQALSFESHANVNTVNQALSRVRGGGAVAPAKKAHNTHNAYGPTPMNIPLVPTLKVVGGYKMPPTKYSGPQNSIANWKYRHQNTP